MLAIVIPYFKLNYFEDTLSSLANQSDKRFKVYIGDDASHSNPLEVIQKYQANLTISYKRFNENLGSISLVQHWDRCIAMTETEDWLLILCDDDTISKNFVADFYENLPVISDCKYNVVRFASEIYDMDSKKKSSLYNHPKVEKATDFFCRRLRNETRSSLSEYIFSRRAYQQFGFFNYDLAWHSDDRAWLEYSHFKEIYNINTSYLSFRLSSNNISRENYQIELKKRAKYDFFQNFILPNLSKFNIDQRKYLLLYFEKMANESCKMNFTNWLYLMKCYSNNLSLIQCVKFTRRFIIGTK